MHYDPDPSACCLSTADLYSMFSVSSQQLFEKGSCSHLIDAATMQSSCMPSVSYILAIQALHICIALLERRQAPQAQAGGRGEPLRQSVERAAAAGVELDSKLEADAVASICHHTPHLAALLDTSPPFTQLVSVPGC